MSYLITNIIEHEEELKAERLKEHSKRPLKPTNISFNNINHNDAPDYVDAYIDYCEHEDGTPFSDDELDELHENGGQVYELLMEHLN